MSAVKIHIPTKEEDDKAMADFFASQRKLRDERRVAVAEAKDAMERLGTVLCCRSGQPYKLRSILFSMWKGKPTSMLEIVSLDWEIRKDLSKVILAFGAEGFFYNEVEAVVRHVGQWDWFVEERFNLKDCEEYLKAAKREEAA